MRAGADLRTVAVGFLAVLLAGGLGAAAGSIAGPAAGALSAVAALVAVPVLDTALRRWDRNAAQKKLLRELAPRQPDDPTVTEDGPGQQVAWYLRPENEVVGFRERPELHDLLGWCTATGRLRVRLVVGPGGAGKTRLALQLSEELRHNGWQPLWVRAGKEGEAAQAVQELGQPCVVVVDYAETREGLGTWLAALADNRKGPQARVVLLARSSGEWWQHLIDSCEERVAGLLEAAAPVTVGPVSSAGGVTKLFGEAVTAFAGRLQVPPPDVRWTPPDSAPVLLVVHAAALLAVLDHQSTATDAGGLTGSPAEVIGRLLRHEGRYWQQSQAQYGLNLNPSLTKRVVAAGTLVGADDEDSAVRLLAPIDDLHDPVVRGSAARWLHDLYPPAEPATSATGEWIGPLRPDLIAENLIVSVLTGQPGLARALMTGLAEERAGRALTVLARAALADPDAAGLIDLALAADLGHLAVPAMAVAVETNPAAGDKIAAALRASPESPALFAQIAAALPHASVALASTAVLTYEYLASASEGDSQEHARNLLHLSNWLSQLGRREDALAATEQAVVSYRQLATAALRPDLAKSLNSQSMRLADLGRREEALAAIEEAVRIYRSLEDESPGAFRLDLADALQTRSHRLADLRRYREALTAIENVVDIYRELAGKPSGELAGKSADFQPKLASSLNSQSMRLADLGRHPEALGAIAKAIQIYEPLAAADPDAFRPELADALHTQSYRLADLGRRQEALKVIGKAIDIYRPLAADHPDAFQPKLASSQHGQSRWLADLRRHPEALTAIEEAVAIYQRLGDDHPDAFRLDLADALHTRSHRLGDLGRHQEALTAIENVVGIYRELAGTSSKKQARQSADIKRKLASALNSQSMRLADAGRQEEALAAIEEAARIYRPLAEADPGAFQPDLADVLHTRSYRLADVGRHQEALAAIEEAAGIYRQLAGDRPGAFRPALGKSLNSQSMRLADAGRQEEALAAIEEAARIYRPLAEADPGAFQPDLADVLHTRSYRLADVGRHQEALAAIEEAVRLYRSLEDDFPGVFEPKLAGSLDSQSKLLADAGRQEEALAAIHEAVAIYRPLAQNHPGAFQAKLARAAARERAWAAAGRTGKTWPLPDADDDRPAGK